MGSRLAILAAQLIVALPLLSDAVANPAKAKELFKKGVDEYKAQRYDAAAALLKQSYELDPKPDALFALAQAERLGGKCPAAIAHYKQLLEQTTDLPTAKAVQSNMSLCPGGEPEKPKLEAKKREDDEDEVKPPPPRIETRTVVREVGRTDKAAVALFATGTLALGAGGGLMLAATGNQSDADKAITLEDHDRFANRASTQRIIGFVALGAGAGLVTYGIVRFVRGGGKDDKPAVDVAISPARDGAIVGVASRW